jgi:DNA repair protein RecN (Recombination protein N)
MLTDLRISHLAIIDRLELSFERGLNVLTGETGAGKSIIVDALGLLTGNRADARLVRGGMKSASVEAAFEGVCPEATALAESLGADAEDGIILIRREVSADGKSRAFLGGSAVPVSTLREIGGMLVDLHGQHQSRTLLRADSHLACLDKFGGLEGIRSGVAAACSEVLEAVRALESLEAGLKDRASRLDLLRYQEQELTAADPRPGEDTELRAERSRLSHAVRIAELSALLHGLLSEEEGSAVEIVGRASRALEELAGLDPAMASLRERLSEARFALEDVAAGVIRSATIEADPARMEAIDSRLALLETLGRKYGGDARSLAGDLRRIREEIDRLQSGEESLDRLRVSVQKAAAAYLRIAGW